VPLLYYPLALVLAFSLLVSAGTASEGERALSRLDTPEERTDTLLKGWMQTLSLGLYTGASDKALERERLARTAGYHREQVLLAGVGLAGLSALFLGVIAYQSKRRPARAALPLVLHLPGVAGLCLLVGLSAPMLTVVAQRDVALLGTVVLQFETKSILSTVRDLFAAGSVFVAVLLFVFSVLVPVVKLAVSLLALQARSARARRSCTAFVRAIGKWSMTDVFVVAVLLAFLAAGSGELTDARLGPGLYFFAAYGLLSLLGGVALSRMSESPSERAPGASPLP
jgi:hypothetical protein